MKNVTLFIILFVIFFIMLVRQRILEGRNMDSIHFFRDDFITYRSFNADVGGTWNFFSSSH